MSASRFAICRFDGPDPHHLDFGRHGDRALYLGAGLDLGDGGFVADPFFLTDATDWAVFEAFDAHKGRGVIAVARWNGGEWGDAHRVAEEPFHLSYPHPIGAAEPGRAVVESAEARAVRSYHFNPDDPTEPWEFERELMAGRHLDPTPFVHDNHWFMFTAADNQRHDTAELWVSSGGLDGLWQRHPMSPVAVDASRARPAGRVTNHDGRLWRMAQDCAGGYGRAVVAIEILEVSPTRYVEAAPQRILGPCSWWSTEGMHHVDLRPLPTTGFTALVDGHRPALSVD